MKCCTVLKSGQHRDYECEVTLSGPEIMLQAICVVFMEGQNKGIASTNELIDSWVPSNFHF